MNICENFFKNPQNRATDLVLGQPSSVSHLNACFALLGKLLVKLSVSLE